MRQQAQQKTDPFWQTRLQFLHYLNHGKPRIIGSEAENQWTTLSEDDKKVLKKSYVNQRFITNKSKKLSQSFNDKIRQLLLCDLAEGSFVLQFKNMNIEKKEEEPEAEQQINQKKSRPKRKQSKVQKKVQDMIEESSQSQAEHKLKKPLQIKQKRRDTFGIKRKIKGKYSFNIPKIQTGKVVPKFNKNKVTNKRYFMESPQADSDQLKFYMSQVKRFQQQKKLEYTFENKIDKRFQGSSIYFLSEEDDNILRYYHDGSCVFPIKMVKIPNRGTGLLSTKDIKRNQIICMYSGQITHNERVEQILGNSDSKYLSKCLLYVTKSYTIIPYQYGNFGHLLNCEPASSDACNCEIIITQSRYFGVIAVIKAKRDIKASQQLCWDYNGFIDEYQTFEQPQSEQIKIKQQANKQKLLKKKKKTMIRRSRSKRKLIKKQLKSRPKKRISKMK